MDYNQRLQDRNASADAYVKRIATKVLMNDNTKDLVWGSYSMGWMECETKNLQKLVKLKVEILKLKGVL